MLRRGATHSKSGARLARLLAVLFALVVAWPVSAQYAGPRRQSDQAQAVVPTPLPEVRQKRHAVTAGDRTLHFTSTTGALAFGNAAGAALADVAYVAYTLEGGNPATRPVAFAFNGGPGSASTWLQLGTMGPWRVPLTAETITGTLPPALIANGETWLDFTDLVFIDPPGTGYSRILPPGMSAVPPAGIYRDLVTARPRGNRRDSSVMRQRNEGGQEWFWSVEGDAATFAEFVAGWLERNGRSGAPVVLVGESYGGFRVPLIAELLSGIYQINVGAIVLVSPVVDFDGRRGWRTPLHYMALLPSLAATRLERSGTEPSRALLAEAETFAVGPYMADLVRGPRDVAAVQRMSERVAGLSGVPIELVQQNAGRLTMRSFMTASPLLKGTTVSIYDAGMTGLVASQDSSRGGFSDPFTAGLNRPLTAAMGVLYERLEWKADRRYQMLAGEVNGRWRWPNAPHAPQVVSVLDDLMRRDGKLRALVVHGFTDLVTPYFASLLQIDQMTTPDAAQRVAMEVYPGGHMFYSRDASRVRFRADAAKLIGEALGSEPKKPAGETRETP